MAKVCIDVGHIKGYNISPAVPKYAEGTRMWRLGEYLIAALKKRGVTVVQTRTNISKDLALVNRGKAAKGCDLFLSLHSNAVGNGVNEKVDYPVAYVHRADNKTTIDERAEEIGFLLAKLVEKVMGTTQKGYTYTRAINSDRDGNGVLDDEYYGVLHGAKLVQVPGVILEHSFHTNTRATNWLLSDTNLKAMAEAEADCIVAWLEKNSGSETKAPFVPYMVRVSIKDLNIRTGPGTNYNRTSYIPPGAYTIVEESDGKGATKWGKLKSGAGWISLDFVKKI